MLSQYISSEDEEEIESNKRIKGEKGKRIDKQNDNKLKSNLREFEENEENIEIENNVNDLEEDINNIIIDDKNESKMSRKVMVPTKKSPFSVYLKEELLSVLRNTFAFHRLSCGAKLMHALSLDMRTPHFVIMKAALILFTQNNSDNNNTLLTQSMAKISKYDINRREIILEMVLNYLRNNNRIAAKEYIEKQKTVINLKVFRSHPIIDTYLKCYVCYCDYLEWKQTIDECLHSIYYRSYDSIQIISDKTKLSLKNIITDVNNKGLRLDIFVLILLEMYEYSEQYDEAIDLLELYVHYNNNYFNAYIYLYNFCVKFPHYSTPQQLLNALENICRLSPENILVLELVDKRVLSVEENFELLMEFIDYSSNSHLINAWLQLKQTLNNVKDNKITDRILKKWKQIYRCYWIRIHFNVSQIDLSDENSVQLILCKQEVISFLESPQHEYVLQTNKLLKQSYK